MTLHIAAISDQPLDVSAHTAAVHNDRAGAVATFVGTVRNHDEEMTGEVVRLDYSAHPDAEKFLRDVTERTIARFDPDGDAHVAVTHRVGSLGVGEAAIVCAVATAHRGLAFDICEGVVDAIKHEVPIWKHQHTADGASAWSRMSC